MSDYQSAECYVLQQWVGRIGLKMQSILLSGLRAPDTKTEAVKKCVRWLRSNCQMDADPFKQSYMQTVPMTRELMDAAIDECEYLTCHYVHHLADAFRVVEIHHPDKYVQRLAAYLHFRVAEEIFHFQPETVDEFLKRHQDKAAQAR